MRSSDILIVDDDPFAAKLAEGLIRSSTAYQKHPGQIDVLSDGRAAMARVLTEDYDLIVMDWNMPYLDGRKTLQRIDDVLSPAVDHSYHLGLSGVPIVVFTGVAADNVDLPHTSHLYLVDFWDKYCELATLQKKADSLMGRLSHMHRGGWT